MLTGPDSSQLCFIRTPISSERSSSASHAQTKESLATCSKCRSGFRYASFREALEHLHAEHGDHCKHEMRYKPLDDPCVSWIETHPSIEARDRVVDEHLRRGLSLIRELTSHLKELQRAGKELHMSVTQPASSIAGRGGAARLPSLPSGVVRAFEDIACLHLTVAHLFSLMSRRKETYQPPIRRAAKKCSVYFNDARQALDEARHNLIMAGIASSESQGINFGPVGPHYVVAVALSHLQNRPLKQPESTSLQLTDLYSEYASKVQFQVNQRPQRRLFLDIRALKEELEAVELLVDSQLTLCDKFKEVLHPNSYRITSVARKDDFALEERYIDRQRDRLFARKDEYEALKGKAEDLVEQVRQSIDILEEGHGKAIRVFTIVTLFFLPM